MSARFHIIVIRHPGGERLPALLDGDRQPIPWINVYLIKRLRLRLSASSLSKTLHVLGQLWAWSISERFPLQARLVSGQGLSQEEIVSRLYPWLRRNFQTSGKVTKLVVAPSTVAFRLNVVAKCITWHLECAMSALQVGAPEIADIQSRVTFTQRCFATLAQAGRTSAEHAASLSSQQLDRLIKLCHPDSPENPWKPPYRQRNYLIVLLLAMLGVRRGELLKLRVSDCLLSGDAPTVRIARAPDDPTDPRVAEPQVKTEPRHVPCDRFLARKINDYICHFRRRVPGASKTPFLFLSRDGRPLSLVRVNGILRQIAASHPEFEQLHPHQLRSTCATEFRSAGLANGLDDERLTRNMMYFFGWRSADSAKPYINAAIRRESYEIGLNYQVAFFARSGEA
ncbi:MULTISPECIES: site-specific integrase [unclassified Caballeronia]|uniref:tyrosine-type recombinase/integrase n=1 Tax=unclassified Caballeronia TaxID=2646786 RepID=UPI002028932D|nr:MULTISPECIES: site-specific integrase [unclassified Caballeronia]